jgi:hypothetical protein
MTQAQTTVSTEATKVAFTLAPISIETGSQAVKAFVSAAKSNQTGEAKVKREYLNNTVAAARLIGVPLTSAQFDKQIAKTLKETLVGKVKDVTSALSKAKTVTLAVLSGDASLLPVMGETMNEFFERVRVPLESAKLADGTPIHAKTADGKLTGKRGAKAGVKKAKPSSAGSVTSDEGGDNAPAKLRAAQILLGDTDAAKRLVIIAESYRDDFGKWAEAFLETESAKALSAANARKRANGATQAVDNANVQ